MKFGYQLGSGAIKQRESFAASGKLNVLRFPVVYDPNSPSGFEGGQTTGSLEYCKAYGLIPHATFFNSDLSLYPADRVAFVTSFYQYVYDHYRDYPNIMAMTMEVGNERDALMTFPVYCSLYAECSDGMERFKQAHPYGGKFRLGGAGATTGGWFTIAVMLWAKQKGHIFDFASWHHGNYCTNKDLQEMIDTVKRLDPKMPVFLTEVGYELTNPTDQDRKDAEDWVTQLLWPDVEVFIWLLSGWDDPSDESGLWKSDGNRTGPGNIILNALGYAQ